MATDASGASPRPDTRPPAATARAVLAAPVCGAGLKLCPRSLDGGCCPDDHDCARDSCYATARAPSTCGTLLGWYACAAVYGGEWAPRAPPARRGAR